MRPLPDRPVPERTGILVIRVWVEREPPGRLRARLTGAADLGEPPATVATAAGVPGICAAVEDWLRRFMDSPAR
ncbi:MAG TPA: hypothetical protein VHS79_06700 [Actinomycetes bacterium]|jgi:hypothetical protein|nr:hypothetical protein [Actinomycetes bacterium]